MTDDELFTAIYLVCGALPSEPESVKSPKHMATIYRRKLPNGQYQDWMVDDNKEAYAQARALYDPAYMEYYEKAISIAVLSYEEFEKYIAWVQANK